MELSRIFFVKKKGETESCVLHALFKNLYHFIACQFVVAGIEDDGTVGNGLDVVVRHLRYYCLYSLGVTPTIFLNMRVYCKWRETNHRINYGYKREEYQPQGIPRCRKSVK